MYLVFYWNNKIQCFLKQPFFTRLFLTMFFKGYHLFWYSNIFPYHTSTAAFIAGIASCKSLSASITNSWHSNFSSSILLLLVFSCFAISSVSRLFLRMTPMYKSHSFANASNPTWFSSPRTFISSTITCEVNKTRHWRACLLIDETYLLICFKTILSDFLFDTFHHWYLMFALCYQNITWVSSILISPLRKLFASLASVCRFSFNILETR